VVFFLFFHLFVCFYLLLKVEGEIVFEKINASVRVRLEFATAFPYKNFLHENEVELLETAYRGPLEVKGGLSKADVVQLKLSLNQSAGGLQLSEHVNTELSLLVARLIPLRQLLVRCLLDRL